MKKSILIKITFIFFALAVLLLPGAAFAMPMFARQIGRKCTYCHSVFPKLNETGRIFKSNGYRFAEEGEWLKVKDIKTIPVAFEVEVEGIYNRTRMAPGGWIDSSDMKVEELEVMAGGALGTSGRISVLGVLGVAQTEADDGSTDYEPFIGPAFVQVNDLIGPKGEGLLNIRGGQWEVALPNLGSMQKVVKNGYFADSVLDVFT
ncbi:MAG: hypothetical protein V3T30_08360, partial [Thermodesulfobacteriota bacterium]